MRPFGGVWFVVKTGSNGSAVCVSRGLDVDLDELGRDDAARFAVDLHQEIGREQVLDRAAAAVDDGDVDGDDVNAGAERRSLFRGLRLLALVR